MDKRANSMEEELKTKLSTGSSRRLGLSPLKSAATDLSRRPSNTNSSWLISETTLQPKSTRSSLKLPTMVQSQKSSSSFMSSTRTALLVTTLLTLQSCSSDSSTLAQFTTLEPGKLNKLLTSVKATQSPLSSNSVKTTSNPSSDKSNLLSSCSDPRKTLTLTSPSTSIPLPTSSRDKSCSLFQESQTEFKQDSLNSSELMPPTSPPSRS